MIHRRGHGLHQHDEHRAQPVTDLEPGAGAAGHDDTQRQTHGQGNGQRNQTQLQRDGNFLADDLGNGNALAVDVGLAQIAVEHLIVKPQQLLGQRVGQAQRLELHLNLGAAHFIVVLEVAFHGHEPQQGKQNGDDDEHGDDGPKDPLCDVFRHNVSS